MDDYDYDYDGCGCCTCCSAAGCHRGPGSQCPTNSDGEYLCPCTETS